MAILFSQKTNIADVIFDYLDDKELKLLFKFYIYGKKGTY